jgi:hypothetical protein
MNHILYISWSVHLVGNFARKQMKILEWVLYIGGKRWGETNNLASLSVIVHPPVSTSHGHIIFQCFQTIEKLSMPNEIIFTLRVLASPHLFSNVEKPIHYKTFMCSFAKFPTKWGKL